MPQTQGTSARSKGSVLIVRQNDVFRGTLIQQVERLGYSTIVAAGVSEAIGELVTNTQLCAVISAFLEVLPGQDGLDLLRYVQSSGNRTPVILVSALLTIHHEFFARYELGAFWSLDEADIASQQVLELLLEKAGRSVSGLYSTTGRRNPGVESV